MKRILIPGLVLIAQFTLAQKAPINWYLNSPKQDKMFGTAVDNAYELLKDKKPQQVIVAVIDSGVEVDHEDLKDVIWVNEDEIPGNGIDDDKNGYIDDVHGWSFLGGATEDIDHEAMEIARMYHAETNYFSGKDTTALSGEDLAKYKAYVQVKKDFKKEQGALEQQYMGIKLLNEYIQKVKAASNGEFSKKTNKAFVPTDEMDGRLKKRMSMILMMYPADQLESEIEGGADQIGGLIKYNLIDADSIRRSVVGDDPNDYTNRSYGCNRYEGPDARNTRFRNNRGKTRKRNWGRRNRC
jgi:hypothetical protein